MSRFRGRPPPENEKRGPGEETARLINTNRSAQRFNPASHQRQASRSCTSPRMVRLGNQFLAPWRPR